MADDTTTIEIRDDQADDLHDRKERGESYKDVIDRLLQRPARDTQGDSGHSRPASGPADGGQGISATSEGAAGTDALTDQQEDSPADLRERMETALADLDVPGRDPAVERTRRQAISWAWARLREEGSMRPRDLANDTLGQFFEEPNLGYGTASGRHAGYQLWDNCVRDVLRELPGVHTSTGKEWSFEEPDS